MQQSYKKLSIMPIPHIRYSFENGIKKLKVEDAKDVKNKIFELMACTAESEFSRKKKSYRDIPYHIYVGITNIFQDYGISEKEVWTLTPGTDERAKQGKRR